MILFKSCPLTDIHFLIAFSGDEGPNGVQDPKASSNKAGEVIPNRKLAELALKITEWEVLAPHLELTEEDIVEIKKDNTGFYKEQKMCCLRKWSNHYAHRASYRCLLQAALACDQKTLVSHLLALPEISEELQEDVSLHKADGKFLKQQPIAS